MKKESFRAWICVWISGVLVVNQAAGQTQVSGPVSPIPPAIRNEVVLGGPMLAIPSAAGDGGVPEAGALLGPQGNADEAGSFPFWADVSYLLWWLKPVCLKPATLTVGSPADPVPGALGQPNTQMVQGGHKFEFSGASGARLTAGAWLTSDRVLSFEAGGFLLENAQANQSFRPANGVASYIPFQDPANVNQAFPFTIPGVVNGSSVAVGSSRLWGAEANFAANVATTKSGFLFSGACLLGFRYLDLQDRVTVTNEQSLVSDPTVFAIGSDRFTTHNQFYGGQIGTRLGVSQSRWSLDLLTKMALGETHQVSEAGGNPLLPGSAISPLLLPGPFLALTSNSARQTANRITLVPEIALNLKFNVTTYLSLTLGYSALYWNKVLCPGDQMDGHVNTTQLPFHGPYQGPGLPALLFQHTDAFAQGLNAGLEFHF